MRAAVYEAGAPDLILDDVDIEDPGPGQVRVRVHHCGVCHSDLTCSRSASGASPIVLGHEAAGVVDAVGAGVTSLAPGDQVVLTPIAAVRPLLLVRARRARLLREQPRRCSTSTFADGTTGLSRDGAAGLPRPRRRRLRRVRASRPRPAR